MDAKLRQRILELLAANHDMSLATLRDDGYPQANVVSYANDGLVLYFATSRTSQKVRNIQRNDKVSLAISAPYADWSRIRGLSMAGRACVLADDTPACSHAMDLMLARYPTAWDMSPPPAPTQSVFVRIVPEVISVLDYTRGFGHADLVEVGERDLGPLVAAAPRGTGR
jgi:PPOX class probable F420-dependent enzyme